MKTDQSSVYVALGTALRQGMMCHEFFNMIGQQGFISRQRAEKFINAWKKKGYYAPATDEPGDAIFDGTFTSKGWDMFEQILKLWGQSHKEELKEEFMGKARKLYTDVDEIPTEPEDS